MPELEDAAVQPSQERFVALREVLSAVKLLPPKQRLVLEGIFAGKSEQELAEALGDGLATVRSLRRFGRIRLASLLEKGG